MTSTELTVYVAPDGTQHQETKVRVTTPYLCAQLVNQAFREAGIEKEIPPQMLYTYVRKGYIRGGIDQATGKQCISREAFEAWFPGYFTKAVRNYRKSH